MKYTCTLGQNYYSDPRYRNVTFAVLISIFVFHVYAHQVTGFVEMVPNEDTNENKELRGLAAYLGFKKAFSSSTITNFFIFQNLVPISYLKENDWGVVTRDNSKVKVSKWFSNEVLITLHTKR